MITCIIYSLFTLSCSVLILKNITMWHSIRTEISKRMNSSNVVIFPKYVHWDIQHDINFSPKVLNSVWNKYQYESFIDIETCTIKYFSDSEYFNKVTTSIPYLNIQWLSINMLAILLLTFISWIIPLGIDIEVLTTTISMVVGTLSLIYMLFHRHLSKKWFGVDDIFLDEPIDSELMMVLSEERS